MSAMALAMLFAVSCKDNKTANLSEKIIGKWMAVDRNGAPLLTNLSHVVTFVSTNEAYSSTSWIDIVGLRDLSYWDKRGKSEVVLKGK